MTNAILYSFRRCPYAMRARFALYWAGIEHEHREISLKNKPIEMLEISPKGTVPILLLPSGEVLEQSLDIMTFAMGIPPSTEDLDFITENDTIFKAALDRYKYPSRYLPEQAINARSTCMLFLHKLEARLSPFMSGQNLSLVDMAIFPFVRQFAKVDPEWFKTQSYPHLKKWMDLFIASYFFDIAMQKHSLWVGR